jgi:DsbC/DsbD-like thiol-disulfide interchange protein
LGARTKLVWGLAASAVLALGFDEPTAKKPVVAALELSPAKPRAGEAVTLSVRVKMADGWHINDALNPGEGAIPTTLALKLPRGVTARGEWQYPAALPNPDGQGLVYEDEVVFKRTLKLAPEVPAGSLDVVCDFGYQACNASTCRPPAKLVLRARAAVK